MVAGDKPTMSWSGVPQPFQRIRQRGPEGDTSKDSVGMRSFVNGIVSPFTACWQPSLDSCAPQSCGPVCGSREFMPRRGHGTKSPPVVSPLADRVGPAPTSPRSDVSMSRAGCESGYASPSSDNNNATTATTSTDIEKPHSNDVLCGRGGSSNRHLGNMHFRELVAANKKTYVSLTKKQKMLVARKIVETVHNTEPAGRFLAKDLDTGLWYDIGLPRSLEKTSQALREKNSNDFPITQEDQVSEVGSNVSSAIGEASDKNANSKSKRNKNVEAPPLIVPSHLKSFYCPQEQQHPPTSPIQGGYHELSPYHERQSWSEYGGPTSHHGRQLEQPHLHQHSPSSPPSSDRYYVPPRTYHGSGYTESAPRSPPHRPHYPSYDSNRSSPYAPRGAGGRDYEHGESHEHYDYYTRRPPPPPPGDYRDHHYGSSRGHPASYGRGPPGSRPPPPQHPHSYPRYPAPRHGPPPSSHYSYSRPPAPGPAHPPTSPLSHHRHPHHPAEHSSPYGGYGHHPRSSPTSGGPPPAPGMFRSPNGNGYIRGKSEVSPERRQEWKRQRNEIGHARRLSDASRLSDAGSLTTAVETSLSLHERGSPPSSVVSSRPIELTSPSSVLQSRSRRSFDNGLSQKGEKETSNTAAAAVDKASVVSVGSTGVGSDTSKLAGLAALATAAFAKLDEK